MPQDAPLPRLLTHLFLTSDDVYRQGKAFLDKYSHLLRSKYIVRIHQHSFFTLLFVLGFSSVSRAAVTKDHTGHYKQPNLFSHSSGSRKSDPGVGRLDSFCGCEEGSLPRLSPGSRWFPGDL